MYELNTTWQWVLQGSLNPVLPVQLYDIDLFDTSASVISEFKQQGITVICYYSAGSYEQWRSDAEDFPESCLGKPLEGWEGERWLDYRCSEVLDIIESRLDLAQSKGCDGVEPDNVDGYLQNTGFSLSYNDQITYNSWTATEAHARGLSVALKNDVEQINDLVDYYDFAVNEECFQYNECDTYAPFIAANKAVLNTEYEIRSEAALEKLCKDAAALNLSSIAKTWDLKTPICSCLAPEVNYKCDTVLSYTDDEGGSDDDDDDDDDDVADGNNFCFAAEELVSLNTGESVPISSLRVGDYIQVLSADDSFDFAEVVFLPHPQNEVLADFIELTTDSGRTIRTTPKHLLSTTAHCGEPHNSPSQQQLQHQQKLMEAESIKPGECLRTIGGAERVSQSNKVRSRGVYSAVTADEHGHIVVNGVVASSFGSNHAVTNMYYSLLHRWLYKHVPPIRQLLQWRSVVDANLAIGSLMAAIWS